MDTKIVFGVVVLAGIAAVVMLRGGASPASAAFAESTPFGEAIARGQEADRPVIAVVTADWCPPCQQLKKNTLTDGRVSSWIESNTIMTFVNSDREPAIAKQLGVKYLPTTVVLNGEKIVASRSGYMSPDEYLGFLKQATGR